MRSSFRTLLIFTAFTGAASLALAETINWGTLPPGSQSQKLSGKIAAADPDIYTFKVDGPTELEVLLKGNARKVDGTLYDEGGTLLGTSAKSGMKELLRLNIAAGTYAIHLTTANASQIKYKATVGLTVRRPLPVEPTDFTPDDIIVSGTIPIWDPEYNSDVMKLIWDSNGQLLSTDIIPATGHIDLENIEVVDTGLARTPKNGPEWASAGDDHRVVYTKSSGKNSTVINQAELRSTGTGAAQWVVSTVPGTEKGSLPKGSEDTQPGVPLVEYIKGDKTPSSYFAWSQLSAPYASGRIAASFSSGRFIPDENALLGYRPIRGIRQIVHFDLATGRESVLTSGNTHSIFPFPYRAPEAGNEIRFIAAQLSSSSESPADIDRLAVFARTGTNWTVVKELTTPSRTYRGFHSAEPFVFEGKSYVSFITRDVNQGPGEVWIASLDPNSNFVRKVSGSGTMVRNDPEAVVTDSTVFIYYSELRPDGTWVQHRCLTGL
jgi:hypothetical protein